MALTDDASIVKRFASLSYVEHAVISARTFPNGAIVKNDVANLRRIVEVYLLGLTYTVRHVTPGWDRYSSPLRPGVCRHSRATG
jgi:hypothetical protein